MVWNVCAFEHGFNPADCDMSLSMGLCSTPMLCLASLIRVADIEGSHAWGLPSPRVRLQPSIYRLNKYWASELPCNRDSSDAILLFN